MKLTQGEHGFLSTGIAEEYRITWEITANENLDLEILEKLCCEALNIHWSELSHDAFVEWGVSNNHFTAQAYEEDLPDSYYIREFPSPDYIVYMIKEKEENVD